MIDDSQVIGLRGEGAHRLSTEATDRWRRRHVAVENVDVRVVARVLVLQEHRQERQLLSHASQIAGAFECQTKSYVNEQIN